MEDLYKYENELYAKGLEYIGGVDEVGRGPLIGSVVAACVVLPKDFVLEGLTDSKKLSEKIRDEYYKKHHQKPSELALDAYNNTDLILTLYEKINGNPELLKCDSLMKVQFDGLFGPTRVVDSEIKYNLQLKECIDLIK